MIAGHSPIRALQDYVAKTEVERGFDRQTSLEKCLLLGEEMGELFKAVRRASGLAVDANSDAKEVGSELADILNYLLAIANRHQIDLGEAFIAKELLNRERKWAPLDDASIKRT